MISSLWLWMTLAVVLFWGVGVSNRLVRMRARGAAALRSVDKHMRQCVKLISLHASHATAHRRSATSATPADKSADWARLLERLQALDQALKDAKGVPLTSPSVARVGQAFESVQISWRQWCNAPLELIVPVAPDVMCLEWDAATLKAQAARAGLNHILTKYNEAIEQFPARLLVGFLGFKPAGLM